MKMKFVLPLVIIFCLFINGCAYVTEQRKGNFVKKTSDVKGKIIKGKTTKTDILDFLGKPDSVWDRWIRSDMGGYYERWYYFFEKQHLKWSDFFGGELMGFSPDLEVVHIDIYFDKEGVVKDYSIQNVN